MFLYGYCLVKHFAQVRNTSAESRSASRMCKVGIIHARFSGDVGQGKGKRQSVSLNGKTEVDLDQLRCYNKVSRAA